MYETVQALGCDAGRSGRRRAWRCHAGFSRHRDGSPMNEILLVEDNPDDVELTLRAFRKSKIANEIIVARDGVQALDYPFATGEHAGLDIFLRRVLAK